MPAISGSSVLHRRRPGTHGDGRVRHARRYLRYARWKVEIDVPGLIRRVGVKYSLYAVLIFVFIVVTVIVVALYRRAIGDTGSDQPDSDPA